MRANPHQLIAFAHVVREGSFSAAATRLGVTQSAVTQHVGKLERQVGSPLLVRTREGVTLTAAGHEFFELADRLVALDTAISERLEGFAAMERGHLRIIANAPLPALRVISQFRQRHPDVEIEFSLHDWTTATRLLRERLADVGLITDPPQLDEWERIPLQRSRYVAYVRPDSPLAGRGEVRFADLLEQTIILPEHGSLTERILRQAQARLGQTFTRTMRISTFPLMCEAVLQGAGIAVFLSESGLIARGLVEVRIAELPHLHETAIVAPRDRARLRLVEALIATAIAAVG